MHSKTPNTWKGIILRRREKIKQMNLAIDVALAHASGKEYTKETKKTSVLDLLGAGITSMRRKQQQALQPKSKVN